ncbi:MAG: immunoglobulin domain-containing protein [Verrucomicrobiota bacterium]
MTSQAQRYNVGDIVENFTLINRENGQPVSLHDMEGKIIFLEWFAYWCPSCQAAAAQVGPGIIDYYENQNGNPHGIEVMHVGVNLQEGAEISTQTFINDFGFQFVLNDFDRTVANRFQTGQQPIFAIINGVPESPSHNQWELLYSLLGYNVTPTPIGQFRNVIDSVQAPQVTDPPSITTHPQSQNLDSRSPLALSVQATGEGTITYEWFKGGAKIDNADAATYEIAAATTDDSGVYEVRVSNEAGQVLSESATVNVTLGFLDSMIADGVPENLRTPEADADGDQISNLIEFLNRTNANDPLSFHSPQISLSAEGESTNLLITLTIDPMINNYQAAPQVSVSIDFSTDFLSTTLLSESPNGNLVDRVYQTTPALTTSPHFARIVAGEAP